MQHVCLAWMLSPVSVNVFFILFYISLMYCEINEIGKKKFILGNKLLFSPCCFCCNHQLVWTLNFLSKVLNLPLSVPIYLPPLKLVLQLNIWVLIFFFFFHEHHLRNFQFQTAGFKFCTVLLCWIRIPIKCRSNFRARATLCRTKILL